MLDTLSPWFASPTFYYVSDSLLRVFLSLLVLLFGFTVAKRVARMSRQAVHSFFQKDVILNSPVGVLLESTETLRGSGLFSSVIYWLILFLFVSIAGEMLGVTFFSNIVTMIIGYIPTLLSAIAILLFGIVVSGVVENVVKRQLKKMMPQQAVLMGTASSYGVLTLFSLIALSELGVASAFILLLFGGLVLALALAIGISLGFGSKGLVEDMLQNMVKEEKNRRSRD